LPLQASDAQDKGGYAKAQDESFYRRQSELLARVVAESDVVVTTAVVPGRKAPVLITADMVASMKPGSVIVDLAAERGGNCELTRAYETVVEHGTWRPVKDDGMQMPLPELTGRISATLGVGR
jgi:NAD(P) transhydrogenase subunit alpha